MPFELEILDDIGPKPAAGVQRIGLKPVTRRVWAPIGERPIAHGHHRFDWLYITAFASPATGETFWYLSNGVSKEFFEALLETFAREAEAGVARIIPARARQCGMAWPSQSENPRWHSPYLSAAL